MRLRVRSKHEYEYAYEASLYRRVTTWFQHNRKWIAEVMQCLLRRSCLHKPKAQNADSTDGYRGFWGSSERPQTAKGAPMEVTRAPEGHQRRSPCHKVTTWIPIETTKGPQRQQKRAQGGQMEAGGNKERDPGEQKRRMLILHGNMKAAGRHLRGPYDKTMSLCSRLEGFGGALGGHKAQHGKPPRREAHFYGKLMPLCSVFGGTDN